MIKKTGPQLPILRQTFARFFLPLVTSFIMLALSLLAAGAMAGCTSIEAVRLTLTPPSPTDTPVPVVATTAPVTATAAATGEATTTSRVFFQQPSDNAIVPLTSTVIMSATGLTIEPAGEIHEGAGHFHILIDTDFVPVGEVIPNDEQHLHFGKAQLETEVGLTPGEHTLRLQFADGAHTALEGDQYQAEITLNVVEDAPAEQVMLVEPKDGDTVTSPFTVTMAAAGLIVEPAGQVIREGAGHFHILVNEDFLPAGEVIPNDETHLHFGKAQLETELTLEPGDYTLRLQMANGAHQALEGDQYRDEIEITVE